MEGVRCWKNNVHPESQQTGGGHMLKVIFGDREDVVYDSPISPFFCPGYPKMVDSAFFEQ